MIFALEFRATHAFGQRISFQQTVTESGKNGTVTYLSIFPKGDGKNRPIPKELQGLPHCVTVNNDDATIKPIIFHDSITGNYFSVESDGRHVSAFTPEGKVLWNRNPFVDSHMEPYRCTKPTICWIGRNNNGKLSIAFDSSQFGLLDEKTGDFKLQGQD
jgi:hypothetical protein